MFFLWLHVCTVFISFFILFYFFTIIIIASPVILSFHSYLKLQNRKHSVSVKLILIKSKHFPSLRRENVFLFSKGHLKKSYPYLFTPPPCWKQELYVVIICCPCPIIKAMQWGTDAFHLLCLQWKVICRAGTWLEALEEGLIYYIFLYMCIHESTVVLQCLNCKQSKKKRCPQPNPTDLPKGPFLLGQFEDHDDWNLH